MKKSKLFKLVKESLKEVLLEQTNLPDKKALTRDQNKIRKEEENSPFMVKHIKGMDEGTLNKFINYFNHINPKAKIQLGNMEGLLQAWEDLQLSDPVGPGDGNLGMANPVSIWSLDGSDGCSPSLVSDGWLICNPNTGKSEAVNLDGNGWIPDGWINCAPSGTINNTANFFVWLATASPWDTTISTWNGTAAGSSGTPGTNSSDSFSDTCPQCQEASVDAATSGPAVGTPSGGNNININIPTGLFTVDDHSCEFGNFCTRAYMDNDWCRSVADGGNGDICTGQTAKLSVFAAIGVDNSTCTWDGCIDVPIDASYVCTLFSGALCNQSGPLGEEQPPGTFTNSGCTAVYGCTNSTFLTAVGGNYSSGNNVDNGDCVVTDYCGDSALPNWICNLSQGAFCDATGTLITSYTDNITQTQTITWGAADNSTCGIYGCADDGSNATYPGRPATAPLNFIPSNYNAAATEDNSCIYDSDGDGTFDWDEIGGCMSSTALNYDPLATDDDGSCIEPVNGCTDDGNLLNNANISAWTTISSVGSWWLGTEDANSNNYTQLTSLNTLGTLVTNPTIYPNVSSPDFTTGANIDDGSCTYPQGCTDSNYGNYDLNAVIDDGSCAMASCMEPTANNYNSLATTDNGSCNFTGCTHPAATTTGPFDFDNVGVQTVLNLPGSIYDGRILSGLLGDTDDGNCEFEGCLDNSFPNFICTLAVNAGFGDICDFTNGLPGVIDNSKGTFTQGGAPACTVSVIEGCKDSTPGVSGTVHDNEDVDGNGSYTAMNYNPASTDSTDCDYHFCNDPNAYNYSAISPMGSVWSSNSVPTNSLCEYEGCTDSSIPSGTVSQEVFPGILPSTFYYNSQNSGCQINPGVNTSPNGMFLTGDLSNTNTNCCAKFGCIDDGNITDPSYWTANNTITGTSYASSTGISSYPGVQANGYDPNALIDDGSCDYEVGCTDDLAYNYDPTAIIDDGSCMDPCKHITVSQCFPKLNTGKYSMSYSCAHINFKTPKIGDVIRSNHAVPPDYNDTIEPFEFGEPCPVYSCTTHVVPPPPFGVAGNFNGAVQETEDCCKYEWIMGQACWSLVTPGQLSGCKPTTTFTTQKGKFEVIELHTAPNDPPQNHVKGYCGIRQWEPGLSDISSNDYLPESVKPLTKITEVEISKRLRKSLKNLYLSEGEMTKEMIKRIIKKNKK